MDQTQSGRSKSVYVQGLKDAVRSWNAPDVLTLGNFLIQAAYRNNPPTTPDEVAAVNEAALGLINGDGGVSVPPATLLSHLLFSLQVGMSVAH